MMKSTFGVLLVLATIGAVQAASDMKPGLWEYQVKMEIPGMPVAMPAATYKHCLTQSDVDKGQLSQNPRQDSKCETKNLSRDGGKISYDIVCSGDASMTGHYDFLISESEMHGSGNISTNGQTMKNTMNAKRIGDCK